MKDDRPQPIKSFEDLDKKLHAFHASIGKKARQRLIKWCRQKIAENLEKWCELKVTARHRFQDNTGYYVFEVETRSVHGTYCNAPRLAGELFQYGHLIGRGMKPDSYIRVHRDDKARSYDPGGS